ncbi:helix-turn-helix domain-containing protein [Actinocrispum sp. NPDC049592]|uniref:TetR/AcrR family transcriptional regulator n=1 Tax=Actinocrispum sp. NPDC049592 TaxID=3154835 RepID=UPI003449D0DE
MTTQRPLRTDAARNAELLVHAAWRAFTETGATDIPMEEIARRAGVGVATLYRRFPSKDDLLLAVLEWRYAEGVEPVIEQALVDDDPWRAMAECLHAALQIAASAHRVIKSAREPEILIQGLKNRYFNDFTRIVQRAQAAGVVRDDLSADDIRLMLFMLISTVRIDASWHRGLGLLLDGLRPSAATPLDGP